MVQNIDPEITKLLGDPLAVGIQPYAGRQFIANGYNFAAHRY